MCYSSNHSQYAHGTRIYQNAIIYLSLKGDAMIECLIRIHRNIGTIFLVGRLLHQVVRR